MFEKVNPSHPDKLADSIAGAIVDLAYEKNKQPKVACEVLIGHGTCHIINETDTHIKKSEINKIVKRISGVTNVDYKEVKQDKHLANNQSKEIRCGDNGIFKGCPITREQKVLTYIVGDLYNFYRYDGKYIYNLKHNKLIACQSNADLFFLYNQIATRIKSEIYVNPLGDWKGGTNVDTGATNRKLGSDMGDAVTGGGLHGKDLSKADVSVNIFCHLLAQIKNKVVKAYCAIGDKVVNYTIGGENYSCDYKTIVKIAQKYIKEVGGFEKLAEWGLIR